MQVLLNAIYAKATTAGNFNTSVGGRIYLKGTVPQEPTFPYCSYWLVDDTEELQFSEGYDSVLVQFDLFDTADDASALGLVQKYLLQLFTRGTTLSVTGYTFLYMVRTFSTGPEWIDEDGSWQYTTQYEIYLQQ